MKKLYSLFALAVFGVAAMNAAPATQSMQKKFHANLGTKSMIESKADLNDVFDTDKLVEARKATRADDWTSAGEGYFRDFVMVNFGAREAQDIPVEMYKTETEYGTVYKLENVYSEWQNPFSDVEYDYDGDYDMYIHLVTVEGVNYWWFEKFDTGIYVDGDGYGEMYIETQVWETIEANQDVMDKVLATFPGCLGDNNDGVLTYPYQFSATGQDGQTSLYFNVMVTFSQMEEGYFYNMNTRKTPMTITLPGVEVPEPVDPFETYKFIGKGMFYNNLMTPFLGENPDAPYEVGIYCETENPYWFHIRNAWGQWTDSESKDIDFEFYFPYDSVTDSYLTTCAVLPFQTTGYVDYEFGEIYLASISYIYYRNGAVEDYNEFAAEYPQACIKVDAANKKIIFPKECVLYDYDYNDTGYYQESDEAYQFEGYIQFPADYEFPNPGTGAVESISSDNVNAPVKYYNLQGVEISNPKAGDIVIKKQGTKSSKILAK